MEKCSLRRCGDRSDRLEEVVAHGGSAVVNTDLDLDIVWTSRDSLSIASSSSLLITSSSTFQGSPSASNTVSQSELEAMVCTRKKARENIQRVPG